MSKRKVQEKPKGGLDGLIRTEENMTPEQKVGAAKTFHELYAVIRGIGPVQGTCLLWRPAELVTRIENLRSDFGAMVSEDPAILTSSKEVMAYLLSDRASITRSYGISAKVGELVIEANKKSAGGRQ